MKTIILIIVSSFLLIPSATYAQEKVIEWAPTGLIENSKEILLEVVIFKPDGKGPFPTVMFNHGSTGFGNDPSQFKVTIYVTELADFFYKTRLAGRISATPGSCSVRRYL